MAVRDMDVAAQVIGFRLMRTKLLAFAVSSFYCGVAGALYAYTYIGTVEPEAFNLDLSFKILFMIIIGGVGSIMGSFLGAAFIVLLPIFLDNVVPDGDLRRCAGRALRVQLPAHRLRRADHLLPDRRAPRSRPAVADREESCACGLSHLSVPSDEVGVPVLS